MLLLFVVPADAVVDPVVVGGLLIELLDVAPTDLRWCYEVCKGLSNFQRTIVDLEQEERAQLFKKFKDAKQHFECAKRGVHSTELARKSQFIFCHLCDSNPH